MISKKKFAKRLKKIMEYNQLSATAFADKIDVPRSSISHLLSERNKPSLEFVLKVLNTFNEVSFEWLVNGQGEYSESTTFFKEKTLKENTSLSKDTDLKAIKKVIIFYNDGTFDDYTS